MTAPFSLDGRVAVVTGAARGLGLEMARGLAQAGAQVFLNGRPGGGAEGAAASLREAGLRAEALPFDVADEGAAIAALHQVQAQAGRLDILVNNVGARLREPLEAISGEALRDMLDVDLVAPFTLSKAAAPMMVLGGYGRVIMISSVQGLLGRRGDAAYITAKGGMVALTRALAAEFGRDGITCNAIAPGGFETETNAETIRLPEAVATARRRTFLGRYGQPHEVAGAAVFLASEAAAYVTGIVLPVDGGWSAAF